jgi:hypothetical protein
VAGGGGGSRRSRPGRSALVVAVASSLTIARVRRQASVGFEKQNCSVRVLTGLPNGSSSKWKV